MNFGIAEGTGEEMKGGSGVPVYPKNEALKSSKIYEQRPLQHSLSSVLPFHNEINITKGKHSAKHVI